MSNHTNRKRPSLYQRSDMREALRTVAAHGVPADVVKTLVYGLIKETSPEGPHFWLRSIEKTIDEIIPE